MAVRDLIPRLRSRTPTLRSESANPLVAFHQEMNRLFEDFWHDFDSADTGSAAIRSFGFPRVEVSETDRELKVEAELPGLDEKDLELLLDNGLLTLRGEKKSETEDKNRRVSERFYGRFERQIPLPVEVQEDKISASFKKGVLTVILPKSTEASDRIKKIPISTK